MFWLFVKADILNTEYVMVEKTGCISYHSMEKGVRSAAFCRFCVTARKAVLE